MKLNTSISNSRKAFNNYSLRSTENQIGELNAQYEYLNGGLTHINTLMEEWETLGHLSDEFLEYKGKSTTVTILKTAYEYILMQRQHLDEEKAKKAELKKKKAEKTPPPFKPGERKNLVSAIKSIVPGFKGDKPKKPPKPLKAREPLKALKLLKALQPPKPPKALKPLRAPETLLLLLKPLKPP